MNTKSERKQLWDLGDFNGLQAGELLAVMLDELPGAFICPRARVETEGHEHTEEPENWVAVVIETPEV